MPLAALRSVSLRVPGRSRAGAVVVSLGLARVEGLDRTALVAVAICDDGCSKWVGVAVACFGSSRRLQQPLAVRGREDRATTNAVHGSTSHALQCQSSARTLQCAAPDRTIGPLGGVSDGIHASVVARRAPGGLPAELRKSLVSAPRAEHQIARHREVDPGVPRNGSYRAGRNSTRSSTGSPPRVWRSCSLPVTGQGPDRSSGGA